MSTDDCPGDIFLTAENFVPKLGMMIQHHEPECHAEKSSLSRGQGHSGGLYDENMTISAVYRINSWSGLFLN